DQPVRPRVRLPRRRRLVLRRAGVPHLLVRALRPRPPGVVRRVPVRDLRGPPARALQRPHGDRRPPVLRRAADTRRGGAGGVRGDPAQGGRALRLAPPDDRDRDVRGRLRDGLDAPAPERRDGEQSPGCSMNTVEKLEMARQLARLQVDVIEAGFPISSDEDFEATREVAKQVGALENAPTICGLSRVGLADIDRCWEAVKYARKPRIHTFVATSDIHLKYKLRKSRAEVLKAAVDAVRHAKGYCEDVEFSPEDASRSDFDYMCDVLSAVIEAGAKTINIPDTVGYAIPREWGERIARIREKVRGMEKVILLVHCHNDLGQAVANSLTAIMNGARQDGVLKEKLTDEIMRPEDIGRPSNKLVLGKHSGRHALAARLKDLGFDLSGPDLDRAFKAFKDLADRKKEVFDEDLMAIVTDEAAQGAIGYELEYMHVIRGTGVVQSATVKLKKEGQVLDRKSVV